MATHTAVNRALERALQVRLLLLEQMPPAPDAQLGLLNQAGHVQLMVEVLRPRGETEITQVSETWNAGSIPAEDADGPVVYWLGRCPLTA